MPMAAGSCAGAPARANASLQWFLLRFVPLSCRLELLSNLAEPKGVLDRFGVLGNALRLLFKRDAADAWLRLRATGPVGL